MPMFDAPADARSSSPRWMGIAGGTASLVAVASGVVCLSLLGVLDLRPRIVAVAALTSALAMVVTTAIGVVLLARPPVRAEDLRRGLAKGTLVGSLSAAVLIAAASVVSEFGMLRLALISLFVASASAHRLVAHGTTAAIQPLARSIEGIRQRLPESDGTRLRGPGAVLLGMMLMAVAVNAAEFKATDERTPHNYRAWWIYDTIDVMEVGIARQMSVRLWVGPFYLLGKVAPGAEVVIPRGEFSTWFPFGEAARSFGRARDVRRAAHDYSGLVELDTLGHFRVPLDDLVSSRQARRVLDERVAFYSSSEPSGTYVVVAPAGSPGRRGFFAFVDMALLTDEARVLVAP